MKKVMLSCMTIALAAGIALSQDKMADSKAGDKKMSSKGASGVLQPEMEPTGGWTAAGNMGEKSAEPWSNTTKGASVDGKPVSGKTTTVTGEVIDISCYLQLGKH